MGYEAGVCNIERVNEQGLTCREVVEIITDYLEDALSAENRRRVEEHLAICPGCANYLGSTSSRPSAAGRADAIGTLPSSVVNQV